MLIYMYLSWIGPKPTMKNCLLLKVAVAVSVLFHQTGVAGQTSSRLCGIAQQEEFQSWLKLNIAEMELEDKESEKDDSKIDFIQQDYFSP